MAGVSGKYLPGHMSIGVVNPKMAGGTHVKGISEIFNAALALLRGGPGRAGVGRCPRSLAGLLGLLATTS